MRVSDYLDEATIELDVEAPSSREILERLVDMMCDRHIELGREDLLARILKREELGTTGIGEGVALPHEHIDIDDLSIVFARTEEPIDFKAIDGVPCQLFLMLVAPRDQRAKYFQVLAALARLVSHKGVRDELLSVQTPAEIMDVFRNAER